MGLAEDASVVIRKWTNERDIRMITLARSIKDTFPKFDLDLMRDFYSGKNVPRKMDYPTLIAAYYIVIGDELFNPTTLSKKSRGLEDWTIKKLNEFLSSDNAAYLELVSNMNIEEWRRYEEKTLDPRRLSKPKVGSLPKQSISPNEKKIVEAVKNQPAKEEEESITVTSSVKTSGNVKFLPETIAGWTEEDLKLFVLSLIQENLPQPATSIKEDDSIPGFLALVKEVVKIGEQFTTEQMNHLRAKYGHQLGEGIFLLENIIADPKTRELNRSITVTSSTHRKRP